MAESELPPTTVLTQEWLSQRMPMLPGLAELLVPTGLKLDPGVSRWDELDLEGEIIRGLSGAPDAVFRARRYLAYQPRTVVREMDCELLAANGIHATYAAAVLHALVKGHPEVNAELQLNQQANLIGDLKIRHSPGYHLFRHVCLSLSKRRFWELNVTLGLSGEASWISTAEDVLQPGADSTMIIAEPGTALAASIRREARGRPLREYFNHPILDKRDITILEAWEDYCFIVDYPARWFDIENRAVIAPAYHEPQSHNGEEDTFLPEDPVHALQQLICDEAPGYNELSVDQRKKQSRRWAGLLTLASREA